MGDPDFNDPLPSKKTGAQVNPESLMMLESMGFQRKHAEKALQETAGDIERAAEWLFSRTGTLISLDSSYSLGELDQDSGDHKSVDDAKYDGKGEYELIAIISHIGSNTTSGHYICHIKKDGMWAIFNDEKVAKSENPPFDLGYMYLFKRKDYSSP
jgi:ubiquitin carboxyl-terminal hydrolase 5/13